MFLNVSLCLVYTEVALVLNLAFFSETWPKFESTENDLFYRYFSWLQNKGIYWLIGYETKEALSLPECSSFFKLDLIIT